ncbi:MAG: restriction endonuclease subunit S [Ilumatobacter sp.]|uniref:restriction endonuclease subunit S n=1 Tax=Ilumatobacter sp. TaxID=1967498 RepID=UPI0039199ED2
MSELPESWEASTVGAVATVQLGRQRSPKNHTGPHMRPYLRSANVTWHGIDVIDVKEMNFEPDEATTFELRDGDLLLNEASGSPAEVGKPAIWRNEIPGACFQNTLLRVRSAEMDEGFLYWYFFSAAFSGRFGEAGRGVNIRHLGKQGLASFPIPIPPLREQRRIVDSIEEHLSRLDAAEASLTAALTRASRLVDVACAALSDGDWQLEPLSDLLISLRNGVFVSRPSADPPGEPILRISAVRPRRLDVEDVRFADPLPDRAEDYRIEPDDVLFTRYSGNPKYVGACAVVPPSAAGVLHPDKLIRGVVDMAKADPRWISAYLSVGRGRAEIEARLKTTAGQVGISGGQLRTVPVATPSLEEQRRRCDEIDRFAEVADWSSSAIRSALSRSSSLRRSVLAAAFSGQLVPQDPTDEPASVLLDRMAEARSAAKPPPRKKKAAS